MFFKNRVIQLFFCLIFAADSLAFAADTPKQIQPVDAIMVIVNDDVITRHELDSRLTVVVSQLKKQGTPLPEAAVLEKQILERMIGDLLQQQFAKETGLKIDDAQLDKALLRIAQQNKIDSMASFRAKIEQDGVDFNK